MRASLKLPEFIQGNAFLLQSNYRQSLQSFERCVEILEHVNLRNSEDYYRVQQK
mgnify:CR=1 FL=1